MTISKALRGIASNLNDLADELEGVTPVPVPPDPPAPTGSKLGWNLGGTSFWTRNRIFEDALFLCQTQCGQAHQRPARFNVNGRLIEGDGNTRFTTDDRVHRAGQYQASAGVTPSQMMVREGQRDQFIDVKLSGDCANASIALSGTDPMSLVPAFSARLHGTGVLRFMGLRGVNYPDHDRESWFRTEYDTTRGNWNNGVWEGVKTIVPTISPERAVLIAKLLGSHTIWWNAHYDDPIEKSVAAAKVFAKSGLNVIYEFGNENWNGFPNRVSERLTKQFAGNWKEIGSHLRQCTQALARAVKGVHACRVVVGTQAVNYGVTDVLLDGDVDGIDGICAAAYFATTSRRLFGRDVQDFAHQSLQDIKRNLLEQQKRTKARGLELLIYEAGAHMWIQGDGPNATPPGDEQWIMSALRSDWMASLYEDLIAFVQNDIGTECCFFTDCDNTSFAHAEWTEQGYQPRGLAVRAAITAR